MNINAFVFSNNPKFRITRHVLFWSTWILYDTVFVALSWSKYPFSKVFFPSLLVEILSFPVDIIFCYSIIYFLIPRFLYKGSYLTMLALWLFFSLFYIICFRLYIGYLNPLIFNSYGLPYRMHSRSFIWDFFDLFSQINMEGCMAAAIKLGKMWYVKQEELDLIKQERKKIEGTPMNGIVQPQPFFLIDTLDKLELLSAEKPLLIPGMIKKIKNLFLYVTYNDNHSKILLKKELELLREYIELEQTGSRDTIRVSLKLPSETGDEKIAPFIILTLVENSFRQLSLFDMPGKFIDIESKISSGNFSMIIAWSKPGDTSTLANGSNAFVNIISKRLTLLYPHSHKLKVLIKPDQFIINLKMDLDKAIG